MHVSGILNGLTGNYAQQVEDLGSVIYVGLAPMSSLTSAPVWTIKKLIITGGAISTKWANGNSLSTNIWDNRASLTYT